MYSRQDIDEDSLFYKMTQSAVMTNLDHFLQSQMIMIWVMSIVGVVVKLKSKENDGLAFILPVIYVIGGIIFQLINETKGRYCMQYYCMLFPIAAYGLCVAVEKVAFVIKTRFGNYRS